jgi:hypothetical protein
MPDSKKILSEIINATAAGDSSRRLAVFDLDSTLFDVSGRSARIIKDFCEHSTYKMSHPTDVDRLKLVQIQPGDWGIREAILRHGWEAPPDFFTAVRDFWRTHFFSSNYLIHDRPYAGAIEFVKSIANAQVPIKYLTGRDRHDMHSGTVQSLRQWGFPFESDTEQLYMKPSKHSSEDEDYKTQILQSMSQEYDLIYFFENEPVIINKVVAALPKVRVIFMDTVHSRQEIPPPNLPVIRQFHTK